eukprot:3939848-Rhodomonas_salina.2
MSTALVGDSRLPFGETTTASLVLLHAQSAVSLTSTLRSWVVARSARIWVAGAERRRIPLIPCQHSTPGQNREIHSPTISRSVIFTWVRSPS